MTEPLLLSSSLGTSQALWEPNLARLATRFDVVRYDHPGHGEAPAGPRTIEGFAQAALAAADGAGLGRFAFCGLSLGGMVGMWLAAHVPERIERLVVACSALTITSRERIARDLGVRFVALVVSEDELARRLTERHGHFVGPDLLASQLATLELDDDLRRVDADRPVDEVVAAVVREIGAPGK